MICLFPEGERIGGISEFATCRVADRWRWFCSGRWRREHRLETNSQDEGVGEMLDVPSVSRSLCRTDCCVVIYSSRAQGTGEGGGGSRKKKSDTSRSRKRDRSSMGQAGGSGAEAHESEEATPEGSVGPLLKVARVSGTSGAGSGSLPLNSNPGLPQSPWPSFMDHLDTREYVSVINASSHCQHFVLLTFLLLFRLLRCEFLAQ